MADVNPSEPGDVLLHVGLHKTGTTALQVALADAPIPRKAIENPIGALSRRWRRFDQIVQPWQFGHGETKATCLWLEGLPPLTPTNVVEGRAANVHRMSPGPDRWKNRSRTYSGVAAAMAAQWGAFVANAATSAP